MFSPKAGFSAEELRGMAWIRVAHVKGNGRYALLRFAEKWSRRAPSTTLVPCAERSRAVASPRPLLAPVMTTTFLRCYCP